MVKHDVADGIASEAVVTAPYPGLTTAKTHVTHNDIVCIHPKAFTGYTDTITGSRLTGYCNVGGSD
ncbi:MAG: hypothetical protein BWY72_02501 [Bacteroidetes bacterium ADurb.Bin416]|nr:MAG: hypothetical protein BWY72_02501 [Bacteroidetes bacterium ADurb.Bin416]